MDTDGSNKNVRDVISKQSPDNTAEARRHGTGGKRGADAAEVGSGRSTKPYTCADCRYATDRKNNLRRHRATMHERCERALECCGLTFVSKSELREHVTERHAAGAGYSCDECGRRFGRRALMRRHAAMHDATSSGAGVRRSADVQRRRSTGVAAIARRYVCSQCDYATGHKSNLDRHLRRHIGDPASTAHRQSTSRPNTRYPTTNIDSRDDRQQARLSTIANRDIGVQRNICRCRICLSALFYLHQMTSMTPSSHAPFMFNLLPPTLVEATRGFYKSILPEISVRQLSSLQAGAYGASTEATMESDNLVDDQQAQYSDDDQQLRVFDELCYKGPGDLPTSSTSSVDKNASDAAAAPSDVTGTLPCDVRGTCHQRQRRRLRLLPLLHTCRMCSLTFVSQLQLKFHSDLFHRPTDLDVAAERPICCRVKQHRDLTTDFRYD